MCVGQWCWSNGEKRNPSTSFSIGFTNEPGRGPARLNNFHSFGKQSAGTSQCSFEMVRPSRSTATITKDLDKFNDYMSREAASSTKVRVPRVMPSLQVLVEQPRSSVMFELDIWREMGPLFDFQSVGTFMGCFGHFMEKPSTLYGNMINLKWLERNLSKTKMANMRQKVLCIL